MFSVIYYRYYSKGIRSLELGGAGLVGVEVTVFGALADS